MSGDEDWRLTGQERYLTDATLTRTAWRETRPGGDHDHCEFCGAKFAGPEIPDAIHEGWTTVDESRWICDSCFTDFRDRFRWQIDTSE